MSNIAAQVYRNNFEYLLKFVFHYYYIKIKYIKRFKVPFTTLKSKSVLTFFLFFPIEATTRFFKFIIRLKHYSYVPQRRIKQIQIVICGVDRKKEGFFMYDNRSYTYTAINVQHIKSRTYWIN